MSDSTKWLDAGDEADVPDDDVIGVQLGNHDIALYRVEGTIFATDNTCTHGQARLSDGLLSGHEIECPLHQGKFDIRNGKPTCAPATASLRCYAVRIANGRVLLHLEK